MLVGGGEGLVLGGRLLHALAAVAVDDDDDEGDHGQAWHGDQRRHDQDLARACNGTTVRE